ncbi:hypothetical protein L6452_05929 [Arctium lappa]|uniref:Uncharacterized protein n=1 Tax=Arctium lappa TaxID=4217 RepID=A0ACB9EHH3_ARCLA|nr:hypothetical protein L6452_05929 [Arctium lappa]
MPIIKPRLRRRNLASDSPPPNPEEMRNEPPIQAMPIIQVPYVEPPKKTTQRMTGSQVILKMKPRTKEEGPASDAIECPAPSADTKGKQRETRKRETSNPLDTLAMAAVTMTTPSSPREAHREETQIDLPN